MTSLDKVTVIVAHEVWADGAVVFMSGNAEVADLLVSTVRPAAKWMTGASLRMDGGEIKGV